MLVELKAEVGRLTAQWNILEEAKQVELNIGILKKQSMWAKISEEEKEVQARNTSLLDLNDAVVTITEQVKASIVE